MPETYLIAVGDACRQAFANTTMQQVYFDSFIVAGCVLSELAWKIYYLQLKYFKLNFISEILKWEEL